MIAKNLDLVKPFISSEDDSELRLAVNEVANHLRIHSVSFYQTAYWLLWLIKIEKFKRSNKVSFRVKRRPVENINEKYWNDWVWLLWEIILNETDYHLDPVLKYEINSLYQIYKWNYSQANKGKKKFIIMTAFLYLKNPVNWNIPIIRNYGLRVQACGNINQLYKIKRYDIADAMSPIKPRQKEEEIEQYENLKTKVKPKIEIRTLSKVKDNFKIKVKREAEKREAKIIDKMNLLDNLIIYRKNLDKIIEDYVQ